MSRYQINLETAIEHHRRALVDHPIYSKLDSPEAVRLFMQQHVFAVWDFMSLLKSLQSRLTGVQAPWFPVGSASTRYLINEIVTGEESDVDERGERTSHFEWYLRAMNEASASTDGIVHFLAVMQRVQDLSWALRESDATEETAAFVKFTFEVIATGKAHVIAAVFTYGREDLIPDMFIGMVKRLATGEAAGFSAFQAYLERHIEVDGGHHGQLATAMVQELCGDDPEKWAEAIQYATRALQMRKRLWDGILEQVNTLVVPDAREVSRKNLV
jgi:hypothetical protein